MLTGALTPTAAPRIGFVPVEISEAAEAEANYYALLDQTGLAA